MAAEQAERITAEELKDHKELQFKVEEAGAALSELQAQLRKHELKVRRSHEMAITDSWDAQGVIRRQ